MSALGILLIVLGYGVVLWLLGTFIYERSFQQAATPTPQERAAERDRRIAELECELGITS